jgi:SUMO ligase MMS21 Smc5/6 complex component
MAYTWYTLLQQVLDDSISKKYLTSCEISNEDNTCPISLDTIKTPVKTQCNHIFDKQHIIKWIRNKKTCPVCRMALYKYD